MKKTPAEPMILGTKEAARFLGVSPRNLRRWANRGIVPCFRIGRTLRFKRFELIAFINGDLATAELLAEMQGAGNTGAANEVSA